MFSCAMCEKHSCLTGDLSNAPKNCPCLLPERDKALEKYQGEQLKIALAAASVERDGYREWIRLEEIMEFANRLGMKKLGLAFCMGLYKEARTVAKVFRSNGFEVESVGCKNCSVDKDELMKGLRRQENFEPMCHPAGQAEFLEKAGTELNVVLGLCVGHDTLFFMNTRTPSTVLAVKDRVMGHNPIAGVYAADGYRKDLYTYLEKDKRRVKNTN